MEAQLDQLDHALLPKDPTAALALFESFIAGDGASFEPADDSVGCIGDAVRAACRHWLPTVARFGTPASDDGPAHEVFKISAARSLAEALRDPDMVQHPRSEETGTAHSQSRHQRSANQTSLRRRNHGVNGGL